MSEFKRVRLNDAREVHFAENEILLSFYDDIGATAFHEWWYEEGSRLFAKWITENDRFEKIL